MSLLSSCKSDITVHYIEPECIGLIKINGDLLECLAQYDEVLQ